MKPRNNTPAIVAVVGIALVGMAALNRAQFENRPRTMQEMMEERDKAMASVPPSPSAAHESAGPLLGISEDVAVGSKEASRVVTLGYSWTPEVQAEPSKAAEALQRLQKTLNRPETGGPFDVRFRLVNTDVVRDVPEGVTCEGKHLADLNLTTLGNNVPQFTQSIMQKLNTASASTKKQG